MTRVAELNLDDAKDTVARVLIRKLIVPDVYANVAWPHADGPIVDLIAVDRAGNGDVHLILIAASGAHALERVEELVSLPAQFRWIACPVTSASPTVPLTVRGPRIGTITLTTDGTPSANITIEAVRVFDICTPEALVDLKARARPAITYHEG